MSYTLIEDAPAASANGKYVLLEDGTEPKRSAVAELGRQVGLTARAGVKGVVSIPSMIGDALGMGSNASVDRLLDWVGLPQPQNATERVSQDVASSMAGQGAFAKLGGFMANEAGPVVSRVGQVMKADPGVQTVAAGAGGGAGGIVREQGGSPMMQFLASLGVGVGTSAAAQARPRGAIPARQQEVLDTAAQHDVPLTYSDVTGKGKRLDTWLEGTPFVGTSKYREQGAKKVTSAAENVVAEAKGDLDTTNFRSMAQVKTAAQGGDKAAQRIVDDIANAGDDWQKIMQSSGNLKLWRSRQAADELYSNVERLAQPKGNMPLTKSMLSIDDALAAEQSSKLPDAKLISTLTTLKGKLTNEPTDFSAARQLRSDLGDIISQSYKGENALVGAKGVGKLQGIRDGVEQDMGAFATSAGGELARAWKRADEFYKAAVVPFKDKALAKALTSDTPDEIYSAFIRTGRSGAGEDRAAKFYDALDPKGKAAVRYGMLSNAMDEAAIPGKDTISPARFSSSLEKIAPARGVFFEGQDKEALDGFVNLMRHAERFGQYTENPPTGQRVIPMISILGAAAWPKLAAAIGGGSLIAREATTRPALRDALIRASNAKAGSVEMNQLAQEVAKLVPQAATSARSASQPQEGQ